MSLISDALRKARQEAAQRGAVERGVAPTPLSRLAERQRGGAGLVVGAVIGLVAAVAGGAAVWWAVGTTTPAADDVQRTGVIPAAGVVAPPGSSEAIETVDGGQAPGGDEARFEAGQGSGAGPAGSPPVEDVEEGTETPMAVATSTPATGPAGGPVDLEPVVLERPKAPDGERVFIAEADLGSVVLSLGYIVFRATDSFAEINGLEVRVGSAIEGFVVEEIERNHVRLHNDDGPLVLRVR